LTQKVFRKAKVKVEVKIRRKKKKRKKREGQRRGEWYKHENGGAVGAKRDTDGANAAGLSSVRKTDITGSSLQILLLINEYDVVQVMTVVSRPEVYCVISQHKHLSKAQ